MGPAGLLLAAKAATCVLGNTALCITANLSANDRCGPHSRPILTALLDGPCLLRSERDRNAALPRNVANGHCGEDSTRVTCVGLESPASRRRNICRPVNLDCQSTGWAAVGAGQVQLRAAKRSPAARCPTETAPQRPYSCRP